MSWLNDNFISRFFVLVIEWYYSFTGDYLLAVILFTLTIKLILLPLDLHQRRSLQKQTSVSAKTKEIQNRYKNDPRMAQQKLREFYKKENIKPGSGCLPLLLQLPILFAMFGAITILSNTETIKLVTGLAVNPSTMPPSALWVHNIWRPDSGNATIMPTANDFSKLLGTMNGRMSSDIFLRAQELLTNGQINQIVLTSVKLPAGTYFSGMVNAALATIPAGTVTAAVTENYGSVVAPVVNAFPGMANGMFIFPVIASVTTFLAQWLQKKQNQKASTTTQQGMAGMEYIMPMITLWWTSTTGVCFAMYWLTNNALSIVSIPLLNKVVRSKSTDIATDND